MVSLYSTRIQDAIVPYKDLGYTVYHCIPQGSRIHRIPLYPTRIQDTRCIFVSHKNPRCTGDHCILQGTWIHRIPFYSTRIQHSFESYKDTGYNCILKGSGIILRIIVSYKDPGYTGYHCIPQGSRIHMRPLYPTRIQHTLDSITSYKDPGYHCILKGSMIHRIPFYPTRILIRYLFESYIAK